MNLSDVYRDNAEDCAFLAERAKDGEVKRALKAHGRGMAHAGARTGATR